MGFFNLVETFFFISLAITFILIMMLVYHFKDRLTTLESKTDTVLEIIHNLIKENTALKSGYLQIINSIQKSQSETFEKTNTVEQPYNRILVSEDEDSDLEDEPESEDEQDSDDEPVSEDEPVIKQIQIHGGINIDVINYDTDKENDKNNENDSFIEQLGIDNFDDLDFEKTSNEINDLEVDISETNEQLEMNLEEIIVTKLDDIVQEEKEENNNIIQPIEVYRKMEIGELRTIVIQKGLATDTKKMKKTDLIRLLTLSPE